MQSCEHIVRRRRQHDAGVVSEKHVRVEFSWSVLDAIQIMFDKKVRGSFVEAA